jgi:predicted translin family RNA/ssDNA-binding protein
MSNTTKKILKEKLSEFNNRREEDVKISRALFEDLVMTITGMTPEDMEKLNDVQKENILLNFSEKKS